MFPLAQWLDVDDVTEEDLEGPLSAEDEIKGWMDLLPDPGDLKPDWLHAAIDDRVAYVEFRRSPLPPLERAVHVNSRVANDMDRVERLADAGQIAGALLGVAVVVGLLTFSFVASALGVALTLV